MTEHPITIAGIVIPRSDPLFLGLLAVHIPAGLICVVAGIIAMLSRKGRGRHTKAGLIYYRSLMVVCATMTVLAVLRWAHAYHLFIFGVLSFASAFLAQRSITHRGAWRVRAHIVGMGTSYVLLLAAFYVDNGKNLPLWKDLPSFTYWGLPVVIGVPLIARALIRHPLATSERQRRSV